MNPWLTDREAKKLVEDFSPKLAATLRLLIVDGGQSPEDVKKMIGKRYGEGFILSLIDQAAHAYAEERTE